MDHLELPDAAGLQAYRPVDLLLKADVATLPGQVLLDGMRVMTRGIVPEMQMEIARLGSRFDAVISASDRSSFDSDYLDRLETARVAALIFDAAARELHSLTARLNINDEAQIIHAAKAAQLTALASVQLQNSICEVELLADDLLDPDPQGWPAPKPESEAAAWL